MYSNSNKSAVYVSKLMALVQQMNNCKYLDKLCYCVLEVSAALYSKIQGSTSDVWKVKYLKVRWLYRQPKVAKDNKDVEKGYLFIEIGTIVSI